MTKEALKHELDLCNLQRKEIEDTYVKSCTDLRVGDMVKFTVKGDSYNNEEDKEFKMKIISFEVLYTGEISIRCGNHKTPKLADCSRV